jgi:hypothetical protein
LDGDAPLDLNDLLRRQAESIKPSEAPGAVVGGETGTL